MMLMIVTCLNDSLTLTMCLNLTLMTDLHDCCVSQPAILLDA